jgi:hypothetical protein
MWSDTFRSLKQKGVPVQFMGRRKASSAGAAASCSPSPPPRPNAAYELIDAILAPATGVRIERGSNHANLKTYELIDERTLAELRSSRSIRAPGGERFLRDYPRLTEYQQMFDETRIPTD